MEVSLQTMGSRTRAGRKGLLVVAAALSFAVMGSRNSEAGVAGASFDGSSVSSATDPAVESLMRDYDITAGQAIAQMENQRNLDIAVTQLPDATRTAYAGAAIDHERGGAVTIAVGPMADGDDLIRYFADAGVVSISTVASAYSDDRLEVAGGELAAYLMAAGFEDDEVSVERTRLGHVTVEVIDGPSKSDVLQSLADFTRGSYEADIYQVEVVPERSKMLLSSCDRTGNIECDPPLRGSVWIHNPSVPATCSAGFNARSRSDSLPYVVTAGHCDKDNNWYYADLENETNKWIGPFHNSYWEYYQDSGIIRVLDPATWQFGQPWITVNPYYGGHTANDEYVISAVALPSIGGRVCLTAGNYPATTCGTVTSTSGTSGPTHYLFRTDYTMCAKGGDSGSPVFSYGVAYGIMVGRSSDGCNKRISAEQAIDAQNWLNVDIITS